MALDDETLALDEDTLAADEPLGDDGIQPAAPWYARAGRRLVRRPVDWWNRPWDNARIIRVLVTSATLVTTTVVMMMIVHLNPLSPSSDLIFDDTTPTGGDMGAHVWAPAFLRDHFLPNFQLSGWSMDWYAGLPLYRFYMVIPALAIVALDVLLPYGVAFKLVAVSGLVLFPLACWTFGRLAAFRHPMPELFAVAGLCFLLDESFSIYGGNVKSTMAGEYSFSIALTLAMFGLGLLANGLRTGRFRVRTAIVLSLAAVSHGIVLIFVAVSATILCIVWVDRRRAVFAVTTGITTLLLSAWWVGPFLFGHEFMTDMKYGFRPEGAEDSFWDMFFPLTAPLDFLITALAIIGFIALMLRRQLTGTALGIICLTFVGLVYLTRDSLPLIGLLWNPRLLPFVYLTRYLLMVVGALAVIAWLVNAIRDRKVSTPLSAGEGAIGAAAITLSCLLVFGWMYETLPFDGRATEGDSTVYAWGPFRKTPDAGRALADSWTRYNMKGYEGRPQYPTYRDLMLTMDDIGQDRGCGRAVYENSGDNGEYGTTMALMLLPHWTDGCIGSMEGLFFEASGTTPYSFLLTGAISEQSSNPVRQLRYVNNDGAVGVQHMQDLGVRYLMVRTDKAKAEAAEQPELELVTTSGPWEIYELPTASIVEPLTVQPIVIEERAGDQRERNLEVGTSWFQRRDDWPAMPADDGPDEWQRVPVEIDMSAARRRTGGPQPQRRLRRAERADRRRRARSGDGQQRRGRSAVDQLRRRPDRRAGARAGQLLPDLGRPRRRGAVPRGAELHGRRADRGTRHVGVLEDDPRSVLLRPHVARHRLVRGVVAPRRRRVRQRSAVVGVPGSRRSRTVTFRPSCLPSNRSSRRTTSVARFPISSMLTWPTRSESASPASSSTGPPRRRWSHGTCARRARRSSRRSPVA